MSVLTLRFCMYDFVKTASDDGPDGTPGLQITLTVGTKTIFAKVPADILEEDPGPFSVDRIKQAFSLRRAVLRTDHDEYSLICFFPKLPRFLARRHSEEQGHVASNTGVPRACGDDAGSVTPPPARRSSSPVAPPDGAAAAPREREDDEKTLLMAGDLSDPRVLFDSLAAADVAGPSAPAASRSAAPVGPAAAEEMEDVEVYAEE